MAATGTCVQHYDNHRRLATVLAGVLLNSTSQPFKSNGLVGSSFIIQGVMAGGGANLPTLQWQGSNDGGNTWVNVSSPFTPQSTTTPWAGGLTQVDAPYDRYQLVVTGGDSGTLINGYLFFMMPSP